MQVFAVFVYKKKISHIALPLLATPAAWQHCCPHLSNIWCVCVLNVASAAVSRQFALFLRT